MNQIYFIALPTSLVTPHFVLKPEIMSSSNLNKNTKAILYVNRIFYLIRINWFIFTFIENRILKCLKNT